MIARLGNQVAEEDVRHHVEPEVEVSRKRMKTSSTGNFLEAYVKHKF